MSDNGSGQLPPMPFKGVNINFHPTQDGWVCQITPNPLTVSEAFRPRWVATFPVPEVPEEIEFTLAQHLSLCGLVLEDIAQEQREPVGVTW